MATDMKLSEFIQRLGLEYLAHGDINVCVQVKFETLTGHRTVTTPPVIKFVNVELLITPEVNIFSQG